MRTTTNNRKTALGCAMVDVSEESATLKNLPYLVVVKVRTRFVVYVCTVWKKTNSQNYEKMT